MNRKINGLNINYAVQGTGEAIFVLHGWRCNLSSVQSIVDIVSVKYCAISFDLPGFGKSDEPPFSWTVEDYADFFSDFIKSFGFKHVICIGHSCSCRIIAAMEARADLPFIVDKIVMFSAAGIPNRDLRGFLVGHKRFMRERERVFNTAKSNYEIEEFYKRSDPDFTGLTDTMHGCYVNAISTDCRDYYKRFAAPTLLVFGENDVDTPVSDGKVMERLIPDAGLVVLKNAGHFCFAEQSYITMLVLNSFLNID